MKDNSKLMSIFKDTSNKHASLIMSEIEELLQGKKYRRSADLPRLMPVWDWEAKDAVESNDNREIGLTVHILARLQSTLDEEHLKWVSGYSSFDITKRLQLLAAINAERRMLEVQLNIKPVEQLTEELPAMFQPPALRTSKAAITSKNVEQALQH